jgi:hypothetical protein
MSAPTAEGGRVTRDTARREVATARCRLTPGIGVEDVARLDVAPSVRERLLEHPSRAWRIESGEGGTFYGVVGVYPLAGVGGVARHRAVRAGGRRHSARGRG